MICVIGGRHHLGEWCGNWEHVLDVNLMCVLSRIGNDHLLVVCKIQFKEVIQDKFVTLGVKRIETHMVAIQLQLKLYLALIKYFLVLKCLIDIRVSETLGSYRQWFIVWVYIEIKFA